MQLLYCAELPTDKYDNITSICQNMRKFDLHIHVLISIAQ